MCLLALICRNRVSRPLHQAVYIICRRGVDSQTALLLLQELLFHKLPQGNKNAATAAGESKGVAEAARDDSLSPLLRNVRHVDGGLAEWHRTVDNDFPLY